MANLDLEEKVKSLQDQAATIAAQQIALSDDVKRLKPEIENLEGRKKTLEEEIQELEKNIASRRLQREEDLNQRDDFLLNREKELLQIAIDWDVRSNYLERKDDDLRKLVEQCKIAEETNFKQALEINGQKDKLDSRENALDAKLASCSEVEQQQAAHNSELIARQKKLDADVVDVSLAMSVQNDRDNIQDDREKTLTAQYDFLQKERISLEEQNQNSRQGRRDAVESIARAEEHDRIYQGQLKVIEEENKKIRLAWLQVNKRIQDNKLDMDLAELQK